MFVSFKFFFKKVANSHQSQHTYEQTACKLISHSAQIQTLKQPQHIWDTHTALECTQMFLAFLTFKSLLVQYSVLITQSQQLSDTYLLTYLQDKLCLCMVHVNSGILAFWTNHNRSLKPSSDQNYKSSWDETGEFDKKN